MHLLKFKKIVSAIALLALFAAFVLFLTQVDMVAVADKLGARNTYILVFLVALVGGVSSLTGFSYYATITGFLIGGVDPWLLALAAAPGLTLGDIIFYQFGKLGQRLLSPRIQNDLARFERYLEKKPRIILNIVIYVYAGFTPFPGDVLMLGLSVLRYPLRKFVVPLFLGNMTLVLVISQLIKWGLLLA